MYFMSGYDFYHELPDAGIIKAGQDVPRELAEETWHRIGADVIDYMAEFHIGFRPPERPIWAERELGPINARRSRVC